MAQALIIFTNGAWSRWNLFFQQSNTSKQHGITDKNIMITGEAHIRGSSSFIKADDYENWLKKSHGIKPKQLPIG
jgi:hypothetical protein